jgi:acyl-CoA thioesterase FadM
MENPSVPEPSAFRFRARLSTRWSDEDNHGVLNNAVHSTLMEEARLAYFGALGLMEGSRFPFLLAALNVRFVAPGRGGAEVEVLVRTTHLGRTALVQAYRVSETASGAPWCEAEARLVGIDPASGAKRAFDARFRAAVLGFEGL